MSIAAILSLDGSDVSQADIERMASVLRPYGPDQQRILNQGNAGFVFCLHKLTPEDSFEVQPLFLGGRFVLLFDGRLDNRTELGDILGISAGELHSIPDSMIALRLFDRWGERAFERIVGPFAIIIVDFRDGRLLCARDHMGLRALHYYHSASRFAVASVPEALFALKWVPRTLNNEKLADALVGRLNVQTGFYQNVFRVLPGSTVNVCGAAFSQHQFWDPKTIVDVRFKHDHDYVEAFRERLNEAVKASLRSRRTPCSMITGGLDSSSISVVAADMLARKGNQLNTFTAVPETGFVREELPGRYHDETPYVQKIAEFNRNIVPHFITQSSEPMHEKIAEVIRMSGLICGTLNCLWGVDMYAAARAAGHNVMLGGDMGNLTMSYAGYGLFTELFRTGHWLKLFTEIRSSGYRWRRHVRQSVIRPFIPMPLFRKYKQWRRGQNPPWHDHTLINANFASEYQVIERAAHQQEPFDSYCPARDPRVDRILDFRVSCEVADWHAKVRANYGLDIRVPAFDRRVVEFCIGLPLDQYFRQGQDRWLIRRAMAGRLPNVVLNQKKTGAQAADWYPRMTRERTGIAAEVKRLAHNPQVGSILDIERLNEILKKWPDRQPDEYSREANQMLAIPDALGVAYFVENLTNSVAVHNSAA